MNTEDFLGAVLPSEGLLCRATIREGQVRHSFYETAAELAVAIAESDAAGLETYFGCASYATNQSRKATNVQACRSLWADIDCGPGKPYPSQDEALDALRGYLTAVHLPTPIVVSSGGGLHLYWRLDRDVSPSEWLALANKLKQSLKTHGFHADPSRTSDIASILRPVGTLNRKSGSPVPVSFRGKGQPVSVADLQAEFAIEIAEDLASMGGYDPAFVAENGALGAGVEYATSSAHRIAASCGVIGLMRDTLGNVDQATWYHSIGVLVATEEADSICQEWSKGHPKYSARETAAKIAQARAYPPTSCAKLEEHQPAICAACPKYGQIKSPIVLGYEPLVPNTSLPAPVANVGAAFGPATAAAVVQARSLPWGYCWDVVGGQPMLGTFDPTDPTVDRTYFSRSLLYPVARIAGEDGKYQIEWEVVTKDDGRRRFVLDNSTIGEGGTKLHGLLAAYEITSMSGRKTMMESYMTTWIAEMASTADATHSYSTFGWHGDKFVVGQTELSPGGVEGGAVMAGSARSWSQYLEPAGTLDVWRDTIDTAYNYPGQEAYQYLVLCGFATVLLPMFRSYGGITVYGWSEGSGHGKTTAMRAALSAWGNWDRMQLADNSTTVNALWAHVRMYGNLPILFDELTNIAPKMASEIVYTVSSGRVKQRANQDGTLKLGTDSWATIMLASGNNSLSEKIAGHRSQAEGELARLMELRIDNTSRLTPNEADKLFPRLLDNYGHAGRQFARFVVDNYAKVEQLLYAEREQFNTNTNITQAERYWSAQQAAILTALRLCNRLDLLKFPHHNLRSWMQDRVADSRQIVAASVMPMAERLGEMLNYLQPHILTTRGAGNLTKNAAAEVLEPSPRGALVGRVILPLAQGEQPSLNIAVSAVRDWCNLNGVSASELHRWGVAEGVIREKSVTQALGKGTMRYAGGTTSTRCWDIDVARAEQLGLALSAGN